MEGIAQAGEIAGLLSQLIEVTLSTHFTDLGDRHLGIAGYTEVEKLEIARKHLSIPSALSKHGLATKEWSIDDEALLLMIRRYTRERACVTLSAKSPRSRARRSRN